MPRSLPPRSAQPPLPPPNPRPAATPRIRRGKRKKSPEPERRPATPSLPASSRHRGAGGGSREGGPVWEGARGRGRALVAPIRRAGVLAAPAARARGGRRRAWAAGQASPPRVLSPEAEESGPAAAPTSPPAVGSALKAAARPPPGSRRAVSGVCAQAGDWPPTDFRRTPIPGSPPTGRPRLRKARDRPRSAPGTPGWPGRAPCRRAAGRGRRRRGHAWPAVWPRRCLRAPRS